MPDMKSFAQRAKRRHAQVRSDVLRKFGREEDGSIIIFTVVLLIMMLVMGGMAVDFMRFESRRSLLQSVADRSVLAAAELDQTLEPAAVVTDFFAKAGFDGAIVGAPKVSGNSQNRTVSVDAKLDINTYYLRYIGIDELAAPASSTATEGSGNVEISLVLDITGSMGESANAAGDTRLELLQLAATGFVTDVLKPEYDGKISMSLVAYSEHVNLGDEIFSAIPTTPPTRFDTTEWRAGLVDKDRINEDVPTAYRVSDLPDVGPGTQIVLDDTPYDGPNADNRDPDIDPGTEPLYTAYSNPSRCVDVPATEFTKTEFNSSIVYNQIENYDPYGSNTIAAPIVPICPENSYEAIIPLSKNPAVLNAAINAYTPRTNTSIHAGMKWGVTLLDPTFQPFVRNLPSVHSDFKETRPAAYPADNNDEITTKYLILMTDGANVQGYRLAREEENGLVPAYENVLQRRYWGNASYAWWSKGGDNVGPFTDVYNFEKRGVTAGEKNTMLQNICSAARGDDDLDGDGVADGERKMIIYTIAMNAPTAGETQMRNCATSDAHYYETEAAAVGSVLETIAGQLVDLRLSN